MLIVFSFIDKPSSKTSKKCHFKERSSTKMLFLCVSFDQKLWKRTLLDVELTVNGLMVALGEELDSFGGAQRRAQQPLPVRVFPEVPKDAGVGGLQQRQAGLVFGLFAGRLVLAVRDDGGLLGVYDEVAEAVVEVEVLHGVADFSIAVGVHVAAERDGSEGQTGGILRLRLLGAAAWMTAPRTHSFYSVPEERISFSFVRTLRASTHL